MQFIWKIKLLQDGANELKWAISVASSEAGLRLSLIIVENNPLETCWEDFEAVFQDWQQHWTEGSVFLSIYFGLPLGLFNSDAV